MLALSYMMAYRLFRMQFVYSNFLRIPPTLARKRKARKGRKRREKRTRPTYPTAMIPAKTTIEEGD